MVLKRTLGVITMLLVCAGFTTSASAAVGDGFSCQNQRQWQVDDTPGGVPVGNTQQIVVGSLSSESADWSLNYSGYPSIGGCTTYIYLSNNTVVPVMPGAIQSYSVPGSLVGVTIVKVQIMAFNDVGSLPTGDDCGDSYHQSYDAPTSQNLFFDTTHILTNPGMGPYTSTSGLSFAAASGVLLCEENGSNSDNSAWNAYDPAGYTPPISAGAHVVHFDVEAMNAPTPRTDLVPPTVALTAPSDGSTVSGITTVSATATDNVAIAGVEFSVDGQDLGAGSASGDVYNYSWNTTALANGSHTLTATATDTGGNTSTSQVTVTVNNSSTPPPTCPTGEVGTYPDCHPPTCADTGTCADPVPTGLVASLNGQTATLKWNGVQASDLKGYEVDRELPVGGWSVYVASTPNTSVTSAGLPYGSTVFFRVRSITTKGTVSAASATVTVQVPYPRPPRVSLELPHSIKLAQLLKKGLRGTLKVITGSCPCNVQVVLESASKATIATASPRLNGMTRGFTLRVGRSAGKVRRSRSVVVVVTVTDQFGHRGTATARVKIRKQSK
jgi:hypothetical protein